MERRYAQNLCIVKISSYEKTGKKVMKKLVFLLLCGLLNLEYTPRHPQKAGRFDKVLLRNPCASQVGNGGRVNYTRHCKTHRDLFLVKKITFFLSGLDTIICTSAVCLTEEIPFWVVGITEMIILFW